MPGLRTVCREASNFSPIRESADPPAATNAESPKRPDRTHEFRMLSGRPLLLPPVPGLGIVGGGRLHP
jgi:hypothetical protein